jgi:thiol-disulfide isomerase/thioredoxin
MPRLATLICCLLLPITAQARQESTQRTTADYTDTERRVQALLEEDGIQVVHFWAPWCHNSRHEFRQQVWNTLVESHPDVRFIFVTVYNDGALGEDVLRRYELLDRVTAFAQPDHGPSRDKANRRRSFMGLPLAWTPSTWIFHRNGTLAYALNYGEADVEMMDQLLALMRKNWRL